MNRLIKQNRLYYYQMVLGFLILISALSYSPYLHASGYGQTVVVISDLESNWYQLYRKWVQSDWPEVDIILRPHDLNDLAAKVSELGKRKPIQRLIFFGHGSPGGDVIFFMNNHPHLKANDFYQLKRQQPHLSQYFTVNAHVEFFNCQIGQNKRLMQAAGDAFLSINGGWVSAQRDNVNYLVVQNRITGFNLDPKNGPVTDPKKWVNIEVKQPKQSSNKCGDASSASYHSSQCKFFRDLMENYKKHTQ